IWVGLVAPAIGAFVTASVAGLSNLHLFYFFLLYYTCVALVAIISRFNKLRKAQERRIEILWGEGHPFIHVGKFLNVGPIEILYRIGISNESPVSTACDVEVKLTEMEPPVNVVIPANLHRMGHNTTEPRKLTASFDVISVRS